MPSHPPRPAGRRRAFLAALVVALVAPAAARADVVTDWNATMLEAQAVGATPAPLGSRIAAIVQTSVFDAVNGIDRRYAPVHVAPAAPAGASRSAAAAGAAHDALVALYPAQKAAFDARLAMSVNLMTDDPQAIADGLAWGRSVAAQVLAWRANDGIDTVLPPYVPGTDPGDWQPTPPGFLVPPLFRTLAVTTPFVLTSASQFRPPGPPAWSSAAYATAFDEVRLVGSLNSTTRTPAQTLTAQFWASPSDSVNGWWNRAAQQLMLHRHLPLVQKARTFALLDLAIADAAISCWAAKNYYDTWRPVTAIQRADTDGNTATVQDTTWLPLLVTPPFQEYPSGHASLSGAGTAMLGILFGQRSFTVTSIDYPGMVRPYSDPAAAVDDIADARTFGGIHFRFASVDGSAMGDHIAHYVARTTARPLHGYEH